MSSSTSQFPVAVSLRREISPLAELLRELQPDTWEHGLRVAELAMPLAERFGVDRGYAYEVCLVHDIGKLDIPLQLLSKPGALDEAEFETVRLHSVCGETRLRAAGLDEHANAVRWHHERPDGLGYPDGLLGSTIPVVCRLVAVADAYDAMRTRPYREPLSHDDAVADLERCGGAQFDGNVLEEFLRVHSP